MAGAAGGTVRKTARLGLLSALCAGCASMGEPPGGPPDFDPPVILSITPDSGAVIEGFDDDVIIKFDEVINERSGNGLDKLVLVSPRAKEIKVSWKRSAIAIKPKDGWHRDVVYQVTLLRGIADLRNNRLDSTRTVIFSTGGEIPATKVSGTVLNWEQGRSAPRALVELIVLPDSLVYFTEADSVGDFTFSAVPPGQYLLIGTIDKNGNHERDRREWFDSTTVQLDSAVSGELWAFAHDSVGPRVRNAVLVDSITIRISFTQMLQPGVPPDTAVDLLLLPDSQAVAIANVWTAATYDSVKTVEDSLKRSAQAAAAEQPADSAEVQAPSPVDTAAQAVLAPATTDTSRIAGLLATRPKLAADLHLRLVSAVVPGAKYLILARVANVLGNVEESQAVLAVPAAADST